MYVFKNKLYDYKNYKKQHLKSFSILLEKLNQFQEENNDLVFNCICYTVESMANFTSKEHSSIIWKCFYVNIY